ncbi:MULTISPECIES: SLATT domain-containing protein [Curtobacterium]|uniref:SLATT domain-containing protein n=1 Tax=Curtobacterium aurantiacum TaxID=3236919 RepID=A0ABS5VG04_9MICO|nr:SLATT domain-containing protein [Curtobacterium flaccumfaciens]MBT1545577.1 SLATT domain-containing protein [Curtobacterium flaccumfaciens pv. flaccumfaciens]MBT1586937.1 SLATT domain-containing protein [Curtobacterium flaccumfaciens pv. flaccumfaciens]MCS6579082.1 SLATT domain-containing protein [Curtobacterium flaccumfaciens]
MNELDRIAMRSYKTYKARLKAAERLQARQRAWNTCLLALSVATTAASVALLSDDQIYGTTGPTVLVCVSILGLAVSISVAGLNYGVRSRDMFMNYRALQRIAVEAEALQENPAVAEDTVKQLLDRYNALLDDSENHTPADYAHVDQKSTVTPWHRRASSTLTFAPYLGLIVPVLVLVPLVAWAIRGGV